jgi:hypothetical protein
MLLLLSRLAFRLLYVLQQVTASYAKVAKNVLTVNVDAKIYPSERKCRRFRDSIRVYLLVLQTGNISVE